jgi:putative glutamine amidotransferase
MRLVSIGNYFNAKSPFEILFKETVVVGLDKVASFEFSKNDVVLLGGGEDISPSLYNQQPNRYTHAGAELSNRDKYERYAFNQATKVGAKVLGICRGAQLICALSGGTLYQHVNNHSGSGHSMTTKEGTVLYVSSAHHQMMNPLGTKHEVLAWATDILSNVHLVEREKDVAVELEPEAVYFNDAQALALQYHPEFMDFNSPAVQYSRELVQQYLIGE